jgi:RNA polymerase sigma factor (sigma-70 family)
LKSFFCSFVGYNTIIKGINTSIVAITEQEKEVFRAIGINEKGAIEAVYKENYSLIQHFVISNNGTEDDARDIFQEAMMVLYEKSRSPEFELTCQIRTYLYSVCRRLWLKKLQYARRMESQVENYDKIVAVEEDLEQHEKLTQQYLTMRTAMGKIGEPCKSLIEAFYVHRKNMHEIASFFGYTNADNAKNQKYKCLVRLKKLFFAQYKNN